MGIEDCELSPAIADDVGDVGVVIDDLEHGFGSGFDQEQESDGFVNIDALPWESGSEVAGGAIHNTEEGGDIMGQLCAAPPAAVINGGECVEQIDAFADGDDSGEDASEDGGVRGIEGLVVGHEEGAAIEEESADTAATPDEAHGICAVAVFGACLCEVFGAFLNVPECILRVNIEAG